MQNLVGILAQPNERGSPVFRQEIRNFLSLCFPRGAINSFADAARVTARFTPDQTSPAVDAFNSRPTTRDEGPDGKIGSGRIVSHAARDTPAARAFLLEGAAGKI